MSVPLQILAAYAASALAMFLLALWIALSRNETVWAVLEGFWRDYMNAFRRIGSAVVPASSPQLNQPSKRERALSALAARFSVDATYDIETYERDVEKILRQ